MKVDTNTLSSLLSCSANIRNFHKLWSILNIEAKYDIAGNKDTQANILATLSTEKNSSVRCKVASNPSTPIDILAKLSTDNNGYVRESVESNQSWINKL